MDVRPVSRPAQWAFSPLDYAAHLLLCDGDHPVGVLKARCGFCYRLLLPCLIARRVGRAHSAH